MIAMASTAFYEVDKILKSRKTKKGKRQVLVKWKGYSSKHNSWEPEENVIQTNQQEQAVSLLNPETLVQEDAPILASSPAVVVQSATTAGGMGISGGGSFTVLGEGSHVSLNNSLAVDGLKDKVTVLPVVVEVPPPVSGTSSSSSSTSLMEFSAASASSSGTDLEVNLIAMGEADSERMADGLSFEANSVQQSKRKQKPPSALEEAAVGSAAGSWTRTASKTRKKLSISNDELVQRIKGLEVDLKAISKGTLMSERQELYNSGGRSRRSLDDSIHLDILDEEQEDVAMDALLSIFPASGVQEMDNILRVLLPEALTRVQRQLQVENDQEDDDEESSCDDSDGDPSFGKGSDLDGIEHCESSSTDQERGGSECPKRPQKRAASPVLSSQGTTSSYDGAEPGRQKRRKATCRKRNRKAESKRQRRRFSCPIVGCNGEVVYLFRHFAQVHKDIPRHEIYGYLKKKKSKRTLQSWTCTEDGCNWTGDRLDKHLASKSHGFDKCQTRAKTKLAKRQQLPTVGRMRKCSADSFVNCDVLAEQFHGWFSSIEGGNFVPDFLEDHKKNQRVTQNRKIANMVKTVLIYAFGNDDFHISKLSELITMGRGSPSVVSKLADGRTWGTVRNYLHAFSHFLAFLYATLPVGLDVVTLHAVKTSLKGCIHTVTKMSQEELQKRKVVDRNRLLRWEDVCNYVDAKMADACMEEFMCTCLENKKEAATKLGKHLLLQLAIQNGKRTGIYADVTVQQFKDAEKEMDGFVVLVDEGKTFRVSGGAGIFLSKAEYSLLRDFIKKCRPLFDPQTDQIFCRASGKRSTVTDIQNLLVDAWEDFGKKENKDVGKLNCSLLRKTLVSRSRKMGVDRSVQETMARHMDHSVSTADRHYDVNTGIRITAKFREILKMFKDSESDCESDSAESDSAESDSAEMDSHVAEEDSSVQIPLSTSILQATPFATTVSCPPVCVGQADKRSFRFGRPVIFSEEDARRLKRCCHTVIKNGREKSCLVTKTMIMSAVRSAGEHFSDLLERYTEAQICSKVRTEIRKTID